MREKPTNLRESSLSRIWQHVNNSKTFAVISAFKSTVGDDANIANHQKLKSDVKSLGLGYVEQKSGYTYMDQETHSNVRVEEMSVFVPNISLSDSLRLGSKYGQESILYKDATRFDLIVCDTGAVDRSFVNTTHATKKGERPITLDQGAIVKAYSQLVRANHNAQRQYAFKERDKQTVDEVKLLSIHELRVPTKYESIVARGNMAQTKWVDILDMNIINESMIVYKPTWNALADEHNINPKRGRIRLEDFDTLVQRGIAIESIAYLLANQMLKHLNASWDTIGPESISMNDYLKSTYPTVRSMLIDVKDACLDKINSDMPDSFDIEY